MSTKADKRAQFKQNLKDMLSVNPNYPIDAVVMSVEADTCTVKLADGFELSDVRLKATADGSDSLLTIPAIGSHVLMLSSDGSVDNLSIIKVDKASRIVYKENGLTIDFDSEDGKVCIKNNSVSLYDLFDKSAKIKKSIKVFTPMGPSGNVLPDVLALINEFETAFKQLLK